LAIVLLVICAYIQFKGYVNTMAIGCISYFLIILKKTGVELRQSF